MPAIGYLNARSRDRDASFGAAFHAGLGQAGFVEGRNVAVEYRWADSQYARLPALAAELVGRQVALIFATPIQAALPAKAATATIPIVFAIGSDPVKVGLVPSLNRPGGNVTGVTWLGGSTLEAKRLDLLHQAAPAATGIAALVNPDNQAAEAQTKELKQAALALGLRLHVLNARSARDIDSAFAKLPGLRAGGLLVGPDVVFSDQRDRFAELALRHAVPAIYYSRDFAVAGGLMSYGTSYSDAYRHAGTYAGRILKGEKPADLPVLQGTKFELVINMGTAKALGLNLPISLLAQADEVIE